MNACELQHEITRLARSLSDVELQLQHQTLVFRSLNDAKDQLRVGQLACDLKELEQKLQQSEEVQRPSKVPRKSEHKKNAEVVME